MYLYTRGYKLRQMNTEISVEQLLRQNYMEGSYHTHVSLTKPLGKFYFSSKARELFWDTYSRRIAQNSCAVLGVAERAQNELPILVDIDLKIKDDGKVEFGDHLYTKKQLQQVIQVYQSVLRNIVEECTDSNLTCVVLEKDPYYF